MKNRIIKTVKLLPAVLPVVFAVLFFGLLQPRYSVVLYTDNIVGEGICTSPTCNPKNFAPFYQVGFYFGSELKKAEIQGYHYDVKYFDLILSDVEEAEIEGFDLRVFGLPLRHYSIVNSTPIGDFEDVTTSLTEDGQRVHFTFKHPEDSFTLSFKSGFAPLWFWLLYAAAVLTLSVLVAWPLSYAVDRFALLRPWLWNGAAIFMALLCGMYFCGSLPYAYFSYFLLNWAFVFALSLLVDALTLPWLGTVCSMALILFWYVANYYVMLFRGKPIMPADLRAIGTAQEVLGGYDLMPGFSVVVGIAVALVYAVCVVMVWRRAKRPEKPRLSRRLTRRGIMAAAACLLVVAGVNSQTFHSLTSFQWDAALLKAFHREGMLLTFINSEMLSKVQVPEGYSREAVDGYLAEYAATDETAEGVRPTNIIMVMNEAFSDLRTVGLDARVDVMPFIDSLDENTVEGRLYVSIFGGGTCNTEFEGLTGNTLAFLGTGAYPYTENVTKPMFSLAQYFAQRGYMTQAFHANEAKNWNRNMVYPNLGFEKFNSIAAYFESLDKVRTLRGHVSDATDYAFVEQVDAENADRPRFLFNVTIQNHSSYMRWEDLEEADSVKEYVPELYMDGRVYLSLIKASDDAVKQLVETYRDSDEPTMIIFFGDHQPKLPAPAQNEIYTAKNTFMDEFTSRFFVWTNYETETLHDVSISANYLPLLVLERGHFDLPPYVRMLREVHEKYPIISAQGVIDAEGNTYSSVAELMDDPLIRKYQCIQYANLYDTLDPAWFGTKGAE